MFSINLTIDAIMMIIDDPALYYMRQLIKANISAASDILAWLIKSNFNVNHRKPCCGLHLSGALMEQINNGTFFEGIALLRHCTLKFLDSKT